MSICRKVIHDQTTYIVTVNMKDASVKITSSFDGEKGIEMMGKGLSQVGMNWFIESTAQIYCTNPELLKSLLTVVDEAFAV